MDKSFLVLKGNFTQKQFHALDEIWNKLQLDKYENGALPIIMIPNSGDMGVVTIKTDGEIKMQSLFAQIEVTDIHDKMKFFNEMIDHLTPLDQQKIYEKLYLKGCKICK